MSPQHSSNSLKEDMDWLYVINDSEMLLLYGHQTAERIFIMDDDGIIRATDEYWIGEITWEEVNMVL
ncbi:hypothetical protein IX53_02000 [Kosmotoga pacifica]|uniref:Uncharacterized protein n=2 Tax=Kosmotoga pacifica TaxID=1330330 RepID=A0A0G2ZB25_9BACT|nr:hypothetical protein IX53_02000 [Kosmotoga pacifica]